MVIRLLLVVGVRVWWSREGGGRELSWTGSGVLWLGVASFGPVGKFGGERLAG